MAPAETSLSARITTRTFFEPFVKDSEGVSSKDELDEIAATAGIEFHYDEIPRIIISNQLVSVKGMDEPMPGVFEPNGGTIGS